MDALKQKLEERLRAAEKIDETGEVEIVATLHLHRGHAQRSINWRLDEQIPLDTEAS